MKTARFPQPASHVNPLTSRGFSLTGYSTVMPDHPVLSSELDATLKLKTGTCERISGVRSRFHAQHETVAGQAATAVTEALQQARLAFEDLDALIYCGVSREQPIPCTAVRVQEALHQSASGVACFDIDASCLGYLRGLEIATHLLGSGLYQRIMICCSEMPSLYLNPEDTKTMALFGDGAVATLLESSHTSPTPFTWEDAQFATYSSSADTCGISGGGSRHPTYTYTPETHADFLFHMQGLDLISDTLRYLPGFMKGFLARNGITMHDIDWVIPHQASKAAMRIVGKRIGLIPERTIRILENHGNQVAASIPIAFMTALRDERIRPGDRVLLLGTGAGLGIGAILLTWERS